jgi:DNA-binding Lrp family transcriptional regulator
MGNLCSIFHSRFQNLVKIINSRSKAQLVDYILLGWQTSHYKLKKSDKKWFMKPYSEIVAETGIPLSSLQRYIKELHDDGLIERRQALYSRTKEDGVFEVKKGTYINLTEKLLSQLTPLKTASDAPSDTPEDIHKDLNPGGTKDEQNQDDFKTNCGYANKNEGTDPLILRGSYIRDLYSSSINNIILKKLVHSVDKTKLAQLNQQYEEIHNLLYKEVKEEVPDEVKKLVLGTFFNLTFRHHKKLTIPKQVVAEYLFSLLNTEFTLPKVTCFRHRNNILAKTIRLNQWKTPKGFFKHFYLGQQFKDKKELREQHLKTQKFNELHSLYEQIEEHKDERLIVLEAQMEKQSTLITELTDSIYQQSSEEEILIIRERIQSAKADLEQLWEQQRVLEHELEQAPYIKYALSA